MINRRGLLDTPKKWKGSVYICLVYKHARNKQEKRGNPSQKTPHFP